MTDGEILLRATLDQPDADDPRLQYADEIEYAQPERAEFIRVQCELAAGLITTRHGIEYSLRPDRVAELRRRETELWAMGHPVCPFEMPHPDFNYFIAATLDDRPGTKAVVSRGFVGAVTLPARLFLGGPCERCGGDEADGPIATRDCPACSGTGRTPGLAGELRRKHPITRVTFTTWPDTDVSDVMDAESAAMCGRDYLAAVIVRKLGKHWPGITFTLPAPE